MGWFEEHLSAAGQWIDDRLAGLAGVMRYRSMRRGPGLGEKIRDARQRAGEAIEERVMAPARRVDPDLRKKVLLGALCIPVLILAGVGVRTLIGPPVVQRASDAEIELLHASLERSGAEPSTEKDLFARFVNPPK